MMLEELLETAGKECYMLKLKPVMNTNNKDKNNHLLDINGLIPGLQKEDRRNERIMRNFQWLMWIMIPVYFGLLVVNPDKDLIWSDRVGGFIYVLAFLLIGLLMRHYYKEYKAVDYSLPTTEMLRKAIKRYKLLRPQKLYMLIPVLLIDVGYVFLSLNHFKDVDYLYRVLIYQAVYLGAIIIGAGIGVLIWRKRQKPLRDAARELLREIESE